MNYIYRMINLKLQLSLLALLAIPGIASAQDTAKVKQPVVTQAKQPSTNKDVFYAVEVEPRFNGDFGQYISRNLRYPEVDKLVGITGKVFIQFVIERDGSVVEVAPVKCLGAGCTSEAVRVISMSPKWLPGIQNSKPVRVMYTVPISFSLTGSNQKTKMKDLQKSDYGFVFFINGQTYSFDDAKAKLGDAFDPSTVENVEAYDNPQFAMPDKKAVYMIVMKKS